VSLFLSLHPGKYNDSKESVRRDWCGGIGAVRELRCFGGFGKLILDPSDRFAHLR
jgi:hypothetical protein